MSRNPRQKVSLFQSGRLNYIFGQPPLVGKNGLQESVIVGFFRIAKIYERLSKIDGDINRFFGQDMF